jgi:hypothetical protein
VGRLSVVMRVKLLLVLFLPALFLALPAVGNQGPLGLATALTAGIAAAFAVAVDPHARPRHQPAGTCPARELHPVAGPRRPGAYPASSSVIRQRGCLT